LPVATYSAPLSSAATFGGAAVAAEVVVVYTFMNQ